jgi:hypothetical protein
MFVVNRCHSASLAVDRKLSIDFLLAVLYARHWELFVGGRGSCSLSIRSFQAEIMWVSSALFACNREKRLLASSYLSVRPSVCLSVCLSVCPRVSAGLALDGFSWCFVLDTIKNCREIPKSLKSDTNIWHLT